MIYNLCIHTIYIYIDMFTCITNNMWFISVCRRIGDGLPFYIQFNREQEASNHQIWDSLCSNTPTFSTNVDMDGRVWWLRIDASTCKCCSVEHPSNVTFSLLNSYAFLQNTWWTDRGLQFTYWCSDILPPGLSQNPYESPDRCCKVPGN